MPKDLDDLFTWISNVSMMSDDSASELCMYKACLLPHDQYSDREIMENPSLLINEELDTFSLAAYEAIFYAIQSLPFDDIIRIPNTKIYIGRDKVDFTPNTEKPLDHFVLLQVVPNDYEELRELLIPSLSDKPMFEFRLADITKGYTIKPMLSELTKLTMKKKKADAPLECETVKTCGAKTISTEVT
jgi:hypothetical protein